MIVVPPRIINFKENNVQLDIGCNISKQPQLLSYHMVVAESSMFPPYFTNSDEDTKDIRMSSDGTDIYEARII